MLAQLIPLNGGAPITIDRDITVVGRQTETCDLIVDEKSISKMHCLIVKTDGLLFVRDLDSTNGTKVNGQRIASGALLPGDKLALANERYRVHLGPSLPPRSDRTEMIQVPGGSARDADSDFATRDKSSSDVQLMPEDAPNDRR